MVCYDVAHQRRRYRLARLCDGYGQRLQESVYQCWVRPGDVALLIQRLERLIVAGQDCLYLYPVCGNDLADVRVAGLAYRPASPGQIVVL